MNLYSDHILDHYHHPRFQGSLDACTHESEVKNPTCGDRLVCELFLRENVVEKVAWSGEGCAISQASASLLMESVCGKTNEELLSLKKEDVLSLLGIPLSPGRLKCGILSLEALHQALHNPKKK